VLLGFVISSEGIKMDWRNQKKEKKKKKREKEIRWIGDRWKQSQVGLFQNLFMLSKVFMS